MEDVLPARGSLPVHYSGPARPSLDDRVLWEAEVRLYPESEEGEANYIFAVRGAQVSHSRL